METSLMETSLMETSSMETSSMETSSIVTRVYFWLGFRRADVFRNVFREMRIGVREN
ncbi:hypothetical protein LLE49_20735 [Alicyclobacillus tolerans]|uniref:hypothetical protein n=1 Tax=Alicyclobacillus tolerans TaxID=90970 RepID=UPI001F43869E|nr:hypothetical protein [Alicyclobacillus tolerans]MCF8567149.1 hypothetical protein [Alicyclobacillus tolerans]